MLAHLGSRCEGGQRNKTIKIFFNGIIKILSHRRFLASWLAASVLLGLICSAVRVANAQAPNYSAELTPNGGRVNDAAFEARIQILTRPIGALVFLDGEYAMAGRTPYTISYFLKGRYRIRSTKYGYENSEKHYVFNGQGDDKLTIKLRPKTRYKALWRSMRAPGWGQVYSDHKTRGFIISLLQFSTAGVAIYQQAQYRSALDDYNVALKNYRANQNSQDGQAALIAQVQARQADLDDAYNARKRWLIITGSVYAWNLIDALFFFPAYHNGAVDVSMSLDPNPALHGAAIGLKVKANF
ncbi:MAG: hypothetical protein ALAOOOJD_03565 [bacterium]|nr:hypothetical protein [bacterium]